MTAFLPGSHDLPGGKCEFGEDPEVAMKREFREETGLIVEVVRPYRTFSYLSDGGRRHTVEIVFLLSEHAAEPIQLGPDHSEVAWVTKENLNDYRMTPETRDSLLQGFAALGQR